MENCQATQLVDFIGCPGLSWCSRQTKEKVANSKGVVRAIAKGDHWRWVSTPRWRRASSKVTSMDQRKTKSWR